MGRTVEDLSWPSAPAATATVPPAAGEPPRVRSFDIFDTLIARRCIAPHAVFDRVAQAMQRASFPGERIAAERAVSGGPYALEDIYVRLAQDAGLPLEEARRLMAAELAAELDEVIPIAENLQRVSDGDLLISDMYLSETHIRDLLRRAGLQKNVGLFVSAHGKSSGAVWPKVADRFSLAEHLGDNLHSDVEMPRRHGLAASHTSAWAPTDVERWLLDLGLTDLAEVIREARLRTWHADPVLRQVQLLQIQLNLPILILSTLRLARTAERIGAERILFSSRDCNMWIQLYETMAKTLGGASEASYFYTSREARIRPSEDYQSYARERLSRRALVVDLCGTGWSMSNLFAALGLDGQHLFFTHWMNTPTAYLAHAGLQHSCVVDSVVGPDRANLSNVHLEMCNYAEHGSVRGVIRLDGAIVPLLNADERTPAQLAAVAEQRQAMAVGVEILGRRPLGLSTSLSDEVITELVFQLYQLLSRDPVLPGLFAQEHFQEDAAFMGSLAAG